MAKIIFFGTPLYVVCVLEDLIKSGHEIVAVVTQPPKPAGRKQIITPSPVAVWSKENEVQAFDYTTPLHKQSLLSDSSGVVKNVEVGVLASYGRIVPKEVLDLFPKGIINIHPSSLPKWRGATPVQEQILAGEKELGISLMIMEEGMDNGPILDQTTIPLDVADTQEILLKKAFQKGSEMLVKTLPNYLSGKIKPRDQDDSQATYTYKTSESKEKAYFNIDNPPSAEELDRMIRAFYPWPICWTKWPFDSAQGKETKIIKLYPERKIQMEGKNIVGWETFKKGYPNFPIKL